MERLKEQQITDENVGFLTSEDLKDLGFPIGPSRQLFALINKLKKQSKNGKLSVPADVVSPPRVVNSYNRPSYATENPVAVVQPTRRPWNEEEAIFSELRNSKPKPIRARGFSDDI